MSKPVTQSANIAPGLPGTNDLSIIPQTNGGFTDDLQFTFDGCNGFDIRLELFEAHVRSEVLDGCDCIEYVLQREAWFSKRQEQPLRQRVAPLAV
jgi:hypothetical protein